MTHLLTVDDTSFRRHVLAARLPVVACFTSAECVASRELRRTLESLAPVYARRLGFVEADCEHATVAGQFGVGATPTLLVFRDGDEVLRSVGFLPEPLLRLLLDDAAKATGERTRVWAPTEERFEDAVVLPLLETMGYEYTRQHQIVNWPRGARNGRIDVLVHDRRGLLTLVESKRALRSNSDLHQAAQQAERYARAMRLNSFLVAAPVGVWVYALRSKHATPEHAFSWLDLQTESARLQGMLEGLREMDVREVPV